MLEKVNTKFGTAKLLKNGYYTITSRKEGNNGKRLHRLIYEDFHKVTLLSWTVIHHIDNNSANNCILNLKAMIWKTHAQHHHKGKPFSEEHKRKIGEAHKGENNHRWNIDVSEQERIRRSQSTNTTGYYHVYLKKCKTCKQGFIYIYQYAEKRKKKSINSTDIKKLEQKVKSKGLTWLKLKE